jgi:hypothetical protein
VTGKTLVLILAALAVQAEEPRIEVRLERDEIYEGESVLYQVSVLNTRQPKGPDLAAFTDFEIRPAGEQSLNSSSVQIINGEVFREETFGRAYRYLLTPRKTGKLTIPAPRVEIGGKVHSGRALAMNVIAPEKQDVVHLQISAKKESVYPLQPFAVRLRIFVRKLPALYQDQDPISVGAARKLEIPWVTVPEDLEADETSDWLKTKISRGNKGFTINDLRREGLFFDNPLAVFDLAGRPARAEDVAGAPELVGKAENYWVYELERTFVPKRASGHRFGPATVKGSFAVGVEGNRATLRNIYAVGKAAHVDVKSVPEEGRPASFTGGVGSFTIEADLTPRKAKVGDPMTLTLTAAGRGNLEDVRAPDLTRLEPFTKSFKIYEATAESKGSRRIFTYSIRPTTAEVREVPGVPFSFFDVEQERYVSLTTRPIPIQIEEAARLEVDEIVAAGAAAKGRTLEARTGGLFANIQNPREIGDERLSTVGTVTYVGSLGLAYFGVAFLVGRWRRLREDPARVRRKAAPERARQRLKDARSALAAGRSSDGAAALRGALAGLVADVSGHPEAGMTARDAADRLVALGLEQELAGRLSSVIDSCDGLRYGGDAGDLERLAAEAQAATQALESALSKKGHLR